jgi:hypothetical protein
MPTKVYLAKLSSRNFCKEKLRHLPPWICLIRTSKGGQIQNTVMWHVSHFYFSIKLKTQNY